MRKHSLIGLPLAAALISQISCSQANTAAHNQAVAANANTVAANSAVRNSAVVEQSPALDGEALLGNLKAQAKEAGQALLNGDFERLADYTHPKAVETLGGREKLIEESRETIEIVKKEGFQILSIETGDPLEMRRIGDEVFVVMPLTAILKAPKGKMRQGSSIVGISSDNGANWKFVNGINQAKFGEMFPSAAGKITIPQDSLTPVKEN